LNNNNGNSEQYRVVVFEGFAKIQSVLVKRH